MATVNVATSQNLTAVTYAQGDIINVQDGVTLTINSQWYYADGDISCHPGYILSGAGVTGCTVIKQLNGNR